jgi:hypothetical protein
MENRLLAAIPALVLAACASTSAPSRNVALGASFELRVGESAAIGDELLVVAFEGVRSDSRCPRSVVCIRAGEGVVDVLVKRLPATSAGLTLKTQPLDESVGRFENYEVRLVELLPEPRAGEAIPAKEYVSRLTVTRP